MRYKAENRNITLKRFASLNDTLEHLQRIAIQYSFQVRDLAKELKRETTEETANAIWNWTRDNIEYELDKKGVEQLRRPARTLHDKRGDCDCLTILNLALLIENNIPCKAKITAYPKRNKKTGEFLTDLRGQYLSNDFSHIYTIAVDKEKEFIIDTVPEISGFNEEAQPITKYKILDIMELQELAGTEKNVDYIISGTGIDDVVLEIIEEDKEEIIAGIFGANNESEIKLSEQDENNIDDAIDVETQAELMGNLVVVREPNNTDVAISENDLLERVMKVAIKNQYEALKNDKLNNGVLTKIVNINNEISIFKEIVEADEFVVALKDAIVKNSFFNDLFINILANFSEALNGTNENENVVFIRDMTDFTEEERQVMRLDGLGRFRLFKNKKRDGLLRKGAKSFLKFSPTAVSLRASALVALRMNMMKMSDKLAYGYLTQSQAKANNLDLATYKKFCDARKKVEAAWVKFGGKTSALKKAVIKGRMAKKLGLHGFEETEDELGIAPAIAGIVKIVVDILKKVDFKKLFKKKDDKEMPDATSANTPSPFVPEREGNKMPLVPANEEDRTPAKTADVSFKEKTISTVKENKTGFIVGGIALFLIVLGFFFYRSKKNLNGVTTTKRKPRRKTTKKATTRKRTTAKKATTRKSKPRSTTKSKTKGSSKLKALHAKARALRKKHPRMKYSTALKKVAKK